MAWAQARPNQVCSMGEIDSQKSCGVAMGYLAVALKSKRKRCVWGTSISIDVGVPLPTPSRGFFFGPTSHYPMFEICEK